MNLFKNADTKEKAKERYNQLSKIYHPDIGKEPSGEMFAELSKQYKEHLKRLQNPKYEPIEPDEPTVNIEKEEIEEELVNQIIKRVPKLTNRQKKSIKKGSSLILSVVLDKILDRV
jgi:DnaJ-class molecular chaperone